MTLRRTLLLLFCLLPVAYTTQAQQDSLDQILEATTNTNNKLSLLLEFADLTLYRDQEAATKYLREAIRIADEREATEEQIEALLLLGKHYNHYQQHEYALDELLKAIRIAEGTRQYRAIAQAKLQIGDVYGALGQSRAALNYLFEAQDIFEQQKDSLGSAKVQMYIGDVFQTLGDYDKAFSYYFDASSQITRYGTDDEQANLAIKTGSIYHIIGEEDKAIFYYDDALNLLHEAQRSSDEHYLKKSFFNDLRITQIADCYNRIAEITSKQGDLKAAFELFRKAVDFYEQIDDQRRKAVPFMNIGKLYQKQDAPDKALSYYNNALKVSQLANDDNQIAQSHHLIGTAYFDKEDYENALFHFNKSLDISLNVRSKPLSKDNYEYISKIYEYKGLPAEALNYYKYYKAFSDSLFNVRTNREIARLSIQHEVEERQRKIDLLQERAKVSELREKEAQKAVWFTSVVTILVVLVLGLVYWNYLRRKRLSQRLAEKNRELERLNEQLSRHEDELMESNSSKDKFFSIVAHDLKAPLNSLKGFTHLLSNFSGNLSREEIRSTSEQLHEAVSEVSEFLEGLLTWSRAQMNTISIEPENIDVQELSNKNFALLQTQAKAKKIELMTEIPENLGVYADRNALSTVFRNLISNAIKFSYKNSAVRIIAEEINEYILIHFVDSGMGMSKESKEQLFRVDVRHTTSGTANEKGTGLGLIICKELIEKNGGTIQVESQKGRGTTFTVRLPSAQQ